MSLDDLRITLAGHDVPRVGYGTMRLTGPHIFGPPADPDEAVRVLRRAVELGVRVIDVAWYYGPDVASELVAQALRPYPDDLVFVSKLGGARRDDASWYPALSPEELRDGAERDLRLLGVDAVPIAHLRWMDNPDVTFPEALDAMVNLRQAGFFGELGLSNVTLDQLDLALSHTPVATVSNAYSVLNRDDDPVVDRCAERGIAYLPFFPLGASPTRSGAGVTGMATVEQVADRHGVTPTQVAIAWLLHRSPVVVPIAGTSSVAHLEENVAAADLELTADDLAALDG